MNFLKYIICIMIILGFTSCSQKKLELQDRLEDINSEVTLQDMAYILEDYVDKVDNNTKELKEKQSEIDSLKKQLTNNNLKLSNNSRSIDILNIKVKNLKQETKESIISYIKANNILEDKMTLSPRTISIDTQSVVLESDDSEPLIESKDETIVEENILTKPIKNEFNNKYKKSTKYRLARVYVPQGVVVKEMALRESKTIKHYPQNTILKIKRCDKFGWCKLYGQRGYVTHFLLNFKRLKH